MFLWESRWWLTLVRRSPFGKGKKYHSSMGHGQKNGRTESNVCRKAKTWIPSPFVPEALSFSTTTTTPDLHPKVLCSSPVAHSAWIRLQSFFRLHSPSSSRLRVVNRYPLLIQVPASKRCADSSGSTTASSSSDFSSTCSGLMVKLTSEGDHRGTALLAVTGRVADFSLDPFAYPIACRALAVEVSPKTLGEEVLGHIVFIAMDSCGHHVLESAIEHGSVDLQHSITLELLPAAVRLSTHFVELLVLRKALLFCSEPDPKAIAKALWSSQGAFSSLASNRFGREVVMTLLPLPTSVSHEALRRLACASVQISRAGCQGCVARASGTLPGHVSERVLKDEDLAVAPIQHVFVACGVLEGIRRNGWQYPESL